MDVLFLDYDGVMNSLQSRQYYNSRGHGGKGFDQFCPICVSNLNYLFQNLPSNVRIICSATRRILMDLPAMREYLRSQGFKFEKRLIGFTPVLDRKRGNEIQTWLDNWKGDPIGTFVILDDEVFDMEHLRNRVVKTEMSHGFMWDDMMNVNRIFKEGWPA